MLCLLFPISASEWPCLLISEFIIIPPSNNFITLSPSVVQQILSLIL